MDKYQNQNKSFFLSKTLIWHIEIKKKNSSDSNIKWEKPFKFSELLHQSTCYHFTCKIYKNHLWFALFVTFENLNVKNLMWKSSCIKTIRIIKKNSLTCSM